MDMTMTKIGAERLIGSTLADVMSIGDVLAKSGFFTDARGAAQAVVKVLAGRELGFGPVASMTGIYVVKGHVTLSANLIAAAIKRSGRYNYRVIEHTDVKCVIDFYEAKDKVGQSSFTMDEANAAGLSNGENWRKYPRNMLFARAMSNGAKWHCADVFGGGVYTPDEMGSLMDGETGHVVVEQEPEQTEHVVNDEQQPQQPETVSNNDEEAIINIAAVNEKSGTTNSKRWTKWDIINTNGEVFSTFSSTDRDTATEAVRSGHPLVVRYRQSRHGNNITELSPVAAEVTKEDIKTQFQKQNISV